MFPSPLHQTLPTTLALLPGRSQDSFPPVLQRQTGGVKFRPHFFLEVSREVPTSQILWFLHHQGSQECLLLPLSLTTGSPRWPCGSSAPRSLSLPTCAHIQEPPHEDLRQPGLMSSNFHQFHRLLCFCPLVPSSSSVPKDRTFFSDATQGPACPSQVLQTAQSSPHN